MFGFEAKDFLTYLGTGLVFVCMFVVRQWQTKIKDHESHLSKIDEALHQIQLQMVRQESAAVGMQKLQNEFEKLDNRIDKMDHHLTRILERLGGKRRATDPDPDTL